MDNNLDRPRLIEVAFPLKQASLDSVHEKNVRHGHISTLHIWPARRPLAACRAALIATLLPDPSAEPKPEGMSDAEWQNEIQRRRQALCEMIGGTVVKRTERKKMPGGQVVEREQEETEAGLAWHVRAWGQWVLDKARRELARFYPVYADFEPLVKDVKSYERQPMRLVPLKEDGTPDIDFLNAEFGEDYLKNKANPRWVA